MSINRSFFALLLVFVLLPAGQVRGAGDDFEKRVDAVINSLYPADGPGAALLVRRGEQVLLRKGYGMANLELGVRIEPSMIFRVGSITKQFTAVGILMLAHEGKLNLDDEIGKYLEFPCGENRVTIEHLLTHTSGIPSYTEMEEWFRMMRNDMTPAEIAALSKGKPFEFRPGERWNYNNTGYIMLGMVIEKIAGISYESFVEERIFKPLGMKSAYYDNSGEIVAGRVPGYDSGRSGFINAHYLSMTQPYAAGSLMMAVDDLAAWYEGLFSGRLLPPELLQKAHTPFRLANGESSGYGYGWFVSDIQGHAAVEHGGGINGFMAYGIYLPEERVLVALFTNGVAAGRNPEEPAVKIAELALGLKPLSRKATGLTSGELQELAGVYEDAAGEQRFITVDNGRIFSQRAGGMKQEIFPYSSLEFFFNDSQSVLKFKKDAAGKVSEVRLLPRIGPVEVYLRTGKELPREKQPARIAVAVLGRYSGEYELAPGFIVAVTLEEGRLMIEPTGQPKLELLAESETIFFLKEIDARIEFELDGSGSVTALILHQGSNKLRGKKLK